eukprot:XP_001692398.1 predicted protein [Chlamydomonas reinhardtii]
MAGRATRNGAGRDRSLGCCQSMDKWTVQLILEIEGCAIYQGRGRYIFWRYALLLRLRKLGEAPAFRKVGLQRRGACDSARSLVREQITSVHRTYADAPHARLFAHW